MPERLNRRAAPGTLRGGAAEKGRAMRATDDRWRMVAPGGIFLGLLGCAACTAPADLTYTGRPTTGRTTRPVVATVSVIDERDVPPSYVGAVMGVDGKPLKTLQSPVPAADAVAGAFAQALIARGELAPPGAPIQQAPYVVTVALLQLNAEQNAVRLGQADVVVRVLDRATGRERYSARFYTESRGDNYLAIDNFALGSPAALTQVANDVLNRAINDTIDKPGFQLALR